MTNRTILLLSPIAAIVATIAVLAMIAAANAQGGPPGPPSLFFGPVSGGPQPGDHVVAFVQGTDRNHACGAGEVKEFEGDTVYDIDVLAEDGADFRGCGLDGRDVRFYFPETQQFANEIGDWSLPSEELEEFPLTAGASPFTNSVYAPNSASDKPID